jgi:geranylgeranylglycerol-phosphate geranylgeranyltransferase
MRLRPAAWLEILRPHNMLAASLGSLAGFVAAGGSDWRGIGWVAVLTALATGAGNVVNDYHDVGVDRLNKPSRPLPSGRLSMRAAAVLYLVCSLVIVGLALLLAPAGVARLVVGWQVALFAYARWCKRWLVVGNLLVAAVSSSAFLAGAMVGGNASAGWVPGLIGFSFVICREVVKGGEDLEGDRATGVRTLAVRLGRARAGSVAAALMLGLACLLPVPALAGIYDLGYFLLMTLFVTPTLVAGALGVANSDDVAAFTRTSRALKLAMFAGIAAIAAGA